MKLQAANKLKSSLMTAEDKANRIITAIEGGDNDWKWADNPHNGGILKLELAKLRGKMNPFAHEFLIMDQKDVKANYTDAKLVQELEKFCALKPNVDNVQKFVDSLMEMKLNRVEVWVNSIP